MNPDSKTTEKSAWRILGNGNKFGQPQGCGLFIFMLIRFVLLSLLLLHVYCDLPSGMVGYWVGFPSTSPIGPWGNNPFNFTILPLQNSTSQWLMSDYFSAAGEYVPGSVQQFWVQEGVGVDYCGVVYEFFGPPGPIDVNFTQSSMTSTQISWCEVNSGCASEWTITLLDENTLNSHLYLDNPVVHVNVTFKRSQTPKNAVTFVNVLPPPCNVSVTLPSKNSSRSGCPHAEALRRSKDFIVPHPPTLRSPVPYALMSSYQFCYILNPAVEFALAWNINRISKTLEIALSLPTTTPTTTYLGFGFEPEFPAMEGADVVMGYTFNGNSPCVRSMYVPYYVGPPVDDTSMLISNTNVTTDNNRLSVYFSRPFDTGHHNITISHLTDSVYAFTTMWAFGVAPTDCVSTPAYHGSNRGVRNIDWSNPKRIFPDWMKCQ